MSNYSVQKIVQEPRVVELIVLEDELDEDERPLKSTMTFKPKTGEREEKKIWRNEIKKEGIKQEDANPTPPLQGPALRVVLDSTASDEEEEPIRTVPDFEESQAQELNELKNVQPSSSPEPVQQDTQLDPHQAMIQSLDEDYVDYGPDRTSPLFLQHYGQVLHVSWQDYQDFEEIVEEAGYTKEDLALEVNRMKSRKDWDSFTTAFLKRQLQKLGKRKVSLEEPEPTPAAQPISRPPSERTTEEVLKIFDGTNLLHLQGLVQLAGTGATARNLFRKFETVSVQPEFIDVPELRRHSKPVDYFAAATTVPKLNIKVDHVGDKLKYSINFEMETQHYLSLSGLFGQVAGSLTTGVIDLDGDRTTHKMKEFKAFDLKNFDELKEEIKKEKEHQPANKRRKL